MNILIYLSFYSHKILNKKHDEKGVNEQIDQLDSFLIFLRNKLKLVMKDVNFIHKLFSDCGSNISENKDQGLLELFLFILRKLIKTNGENFINIQGFNSLVKHFLVFISINEFWKSYVFPKSLDQFTNSNNFLIKNIDLMKPVLDFFIDESDQTSNFLKIIDGPFFSKLKNSEIYYPLNLIFLEITLKLLLNTEEDNSIFIDDWNFYFQTILSVSTETLGLNKGTVYCIFNKIIFENYFKSNIIFNNIPSLKLIQDYSLIIEDIYKNLEEYANEETEYSNFNFWIKIKCSVKIVDILYQSFKNLKNFTLILDKKLLNLFSKLFKICYTFTYIFFYHFILFFFSLESLF